MAAKTAVKVKKKKWFEIYAPALFNEQPVGETFVTEKELVAGKTLKINLMELTRDIKKQHIVVTLKVNDVKENRATTEVMAFQIVPSAIKRQVRRRRDKLDDSFACRTADKKLVRIKPVMLTAFNAKGSVQTTLYRAMRRLVAATLKRLSYDDLMRDIVSQKLQNYLKDNLSKVYPLRYCDIRYAGLLTKPARVVIGETDYAEDLERAKRKSKKAQPEEAELSEEKEEAAAQAE